MYTIYKLAWNEDDWSCIAEYNAGIGNDKTASEVKTVGGVDFWENNSNEHRCEMFPFGWMIKLT